MAIATKQKNAGAIFHSTILDRRIYTYNNQTCGIALVVRVQDPFYSEK